MSENRKKKYRKAYVGRSIPQAQPDFSAEIQRLNQKIEQLDLENKRLKEENINLRKQKLVGKSNTSASKSKYDISWTWIKKISFLLQRANRPMQLTEIHRELIQEDEIIRQINDLSRVLSVHLSTAIKKGALKRYKIKGNGHFYYCLLSWFENESLKNEFVIKLLK